MLICTVELMLFMEFLLLVVNYAVVGQLSLNDKIEFLWVEVADVAFLCLLGNEVGDFVYVYIDILVVAVEDSALVVVVVDGVKEEVELVVTVLLFQVLWQSFTYKGYGLDRKSVV